MKICTKCRTEKSYNDFKKNVSKKDGLSSHCKSCTREYSVTYKAKNLEKHKKYQRDYHKVHKQETNMAYQQAYRFRNKYGITVAEFEDMLHAQKGKCAICNRLETSISSTGRIKQLSVDHDHITGRIRGLLCSKCNKALGFFEDNIKSLQSAINYLDNYGEII